VREREIERGGERESEREKTKIYTVAFSSVLSQKNLVHA
jgi:hypothetical protein